MRENCLFGAINEINKIKKNERRNPTKEEIALIIKKYEIKGFFDRRKLVKEAAIGIKDIEDLLETYKGLEEGVTKEELDFLVLSLQTAEQKQKESINFMIDSEGGIPDEEVQKMEHEKACLVVLADLFGVLSDEYRKYKEEHPEEYQKAFEEYCGIINHKKF